MNLVKFILKSRFVIYLLAITLCVAGLFCLFIMPIAPFPLPKFNNFMVRIGYSGANAATVQQQITTKVVNALQALPHLENIEARSTNGKAIINFTVDSSEKNIVMQTQMSVRQAIAGAGLPTAAGSPNIEQDADEAGLLEYMVTSDHLSLFQIGNYLSANLYPALSSIPGVFLDYDHQDPVVHVQWQPNKLSQYNLQPQQVSQIVDQSFQSLPLGKLYVAQHPYTLLLQNRLQSLPDFSKLIIGYQNSNSTFIPENSTRISKGDPSSSASSIKTASGNPITLGDVAKISFGPRELILDSASLYDGHPALNFMLLTTGVANPFVVAKETHAAIKNINDTLPSDMKLINTYDSVDNMRSSFNEVLFTIAISSILVLLIAWGFLGRLRLTVIPIVTIPICLLGAIIFITMLGFSLNIITLLAMVIAVGLVVDDSIVVVENIISHMESGMSKMEAIVQGTSSIALTVVGITATLLAVYLPISFVHGQAFIFFLTAFAVPLAAAVFISGIVALTLTPVMCMTFIDDASPSRYQLAFNSVLSKIIEAYQFILRRLLIRPMLPIMVVAALISIGIYMLHNMPRKFFPNDPNGSINISIHAAAQDTIESLKGKLDVFSKFTHSDKVKDYFVQIQPSRNSGRLRAQLHLHYKPQYLHDIKYITDDISKFIKKNNLENTNVRMGDFSNSGGDYDIEVMLYGAKPIAEINKEIISLTKIVEKSSVFSAADNNISRPHKQLAFTIDSAKAARFGVYQTDVASLLSAYYGGHTLHNEFEIAGLSVPVVLGLDSKSLQDPNSLQKLQIKSSDGKSYPMAQFVDIGMVSQPIRITTFNDKPAVLMEMQLSKGHSLSEAIPYFNNLASKYAPGLSLQYQGNAETFIKGSSQSTMVAILGIACVYLFLALLFHSLLDPFIILLTVPFSIVGGALSLHLFCGSINLYSTLSLITLVGLITKHGVLIVRFANDQLQRGAEVRDAVLLAVHDRFRPIIMTTLAMTLGVLPLALSTQQMYVARRDLAVVLMGGLLIGTLFSLFVVPLVYTLLKRKRA